MSGQFPGTRYHTVAGVYKACVFPTCFGVYFTFGHSTTRFTVMQCSTCHSTATENVQASNAAARSATGKRLGLCKPRKVSLPCRLWPWNQRVSDGPKEIDSGLHVSDPSVYSTGINWSWFIYFLVDIEVLFLPKAITFQRGALIWAWWLVPPMECEMSSRLRLKHPPLNKNMQH